MVSREAVEEPVKATIAKLVHAGVIATWNRENPNSGHLIELDVTHTKTPLEVFDVMNRFLMWLGSKERLGHPPSAINYIGTFHVHQGANVFFHDDIFTLTVVDLAASDGRSVVRVDLTLVPYYRKFDSFWVEDKPKVLISSVSHIARQEDR